MTYPHGEPRAWTVQCQSPTCAQPHQTNSGSTLLVSLRTPMSRPTHTRRDAGPGAQHSTERVKSTAMTYHKRSSSTPRRPKQLVFEPLITTETAMPSLRIRPLQMHGLKGLACLMRVTPASKPAPHACGCTIPFAHTFSRCHKENNIPNS